MKDYIFQARGGAESGSAVSVSTQIIIQNFSDIESPAELEFMRQKLLEMGGTPPELPFKTSAALTRDIPAPDLIRTPKKAQ